MNSLHRNTAGNQSSQEIGESRHITRGYKVVALKEIKKETSLSIRAISSFQHVVWKELTESNAMYEALREKQQTL